MATKKAGDPKKEALKKEFKERASRHLAKGKLSEALEEYLQLWKLSPDDFRIKLKIGELLQKLGRAREAIAVYKKVAEAYAKDGFLIQAISVCKIVLEIDPAEVEIKNLLASLYAQRGMAQDGKPVDRKGDTAELPKNAEALLDELFAEDADASPQDLPEIPLFSDLTREEFHAVIDMLTPWKVPEGTVICQQGSPAESMFVISHGSVRVSVEKEAGKGKTVDLAVLKPGDFFGEIGLFTRSNRTASCIAAEETELLEIKRADFEQIVGRFPHAKGVLNKFYNLRVLDTILAKSELFGSLKAELRRELANRFQAQEYVDGQFIVKEGDEGDSMFMIRDGEVVVVTHKDHQELLLATLGPGNFFGEVALLSGKKRTASVRAKSFCEAIVLKREDFMWVFKQSPEFSKVVKAYVDKRVQETITAMSKKGS